MDNHDELVYCPPNWIKLNSRYDLQPLVDHFNQHGRDIKAIMQFESDFHPDKRFKSQK